LSTWASHLYDAQHSFVWKLGTDLLSTLNAQKGEQILDIGCGTGHLTAKIAEAGATVVGLDSSVDMIGQARQNYPKLAFRLGDAADFNVQQPVDAVFSNAALHWVLDAESAVKHIRRALKPGGRFVAELGAKGNIGTVVRAVNDVMKSRGLEPGQPWYFPSLGEYASLLEKHGFFVRSASHFERPTQLEPPDESMQDWLTMFGGALLNGSTSEELVDEIVGRLRPELFRAGRWEVDYVRLRVVAFVPL
jgi:trans-aconitate methyltransferase